MPLLRYFMVPAEHSLRSCSLCRAISRNRNDQPRRRGKAGHSNRFGQAWSTAGGHRYPCASRGHSCFGPTRISALPFNLVTALSIRRSDKPRHFRPWHHRELPTDNENACLPEYIGSRSAHRQNGAFEASSPSLRFRAIATFFVCRAALHLVADCIVLTESIWSDAGQKSRHREWKR